MVRRTQHKAPTATARIPLSVIKPTPPTVDGCETVSLFRIGKIRPTTGTTPVPNAGLEIGIGAKTQERRFVATATSCPLGVFNTTFPVFSFGVSCEVL